MKIIFMGNPEFSCPSLKALYSSDHDLVGVISNKPKRMKRSMDKSFTPLGSLAIDLDQNLFTTDNLSDTNLQTWAKKLKPDIFIVVAFKILPITLLEIPKIGAINLHASLLPRYRGAAPIQHALINGDKVTGNSTFFIKPKVDTGKIILQEKILIDNKDNYESLSKKMSNSGAELLLKSLDKINDPGFKALEQNDKKATYAPKIDKSFCKINWNESAQSIHSKVRALSPVPSAFTLLNGKRLKIYDTRLVKDPLKSPPGSITHINDKILISCFDSQLELISVQYEGKKRMSAIDWIRGINYTSGFSFD